MTRPPPHIFAPSLERRLSNGLTILVREDRTAPVVAVLTHIKAGYFDEPDECVGISHVLEHMYFKGTERRGVGRMAQETKALGGYLNAGTIYDYTSYYTVLPSSALSLALDIQADALRNSVLDAGELEKELGVIIEEVKRKRDNPHAVAVESLYETLFDEHRIRRWRIGEEDVLRGLRREDLLAFREAHYRPEKIILVVAGDVDAADAVDTIEGLYGDMEPGAAPTSRGPEEPEGHGLRFRARPGEIVESYLEWGWRTPGPLHEDAPALHLLSVVLGQGRASRLYSQVRDRGVVTGISAYQYMPADLGVFTISAELLPEDTESALREIWRAVDALGRDGITADELERARNILEARLLARLETAEGQARMLAEWQALGSWRELERYLERLGRTTAEDVELAARRYLALEESAILLYHPSSDPPAIDAPEEARLLLQGTAGIPARPAPAPRPPEPRAPRPLAEPSHEDGVVFFRTEQGLDIAVKPRPGAPLVSMALCFRGGKLLESAASAGITALMMRASLTGTQTRSAARLAEETEALGGSLSFGASADVFYWSLGVPARHFGAGFHLLADAAVRPTFPEAELERERKVALSAVERVRDDMMRYPTRLFLEGAFVGHPYGFSLATSEAGLRRATPDEVRSWHRRQVTASTPLVVVVGDVDPPEAAARVAAELADVGLVAGGASSPGPPSWPAGVVEVADERPKSQSALLMGFPGPPRQDPDVYPLQVLSNVLSGLGGRLFEELRGRRSLAYTVGAHPLLRWRAGAFVAYVATSPEREDEARQSLLAELQRVAEEPVTRDELRRAQEFTIGSWKIRSQTSGIQLGELTDAILLGEGVREIREFEARVRAVTEADVLRAFRKVFDPERRVEGVVRGRPA